MTDPIHSGDHHPPSAGRPTGGHPHPTRRAAPHPQPSGRWPSRNGMASLAWAGGAVLVVGLVAWITLPPSRVALDAQCRPDGLAATLSAAIYGNTFWRAQQSALADEIQLLNGLPAADLRAREQQQAGAIEKKMDRLSNQEAASDAAVQEKALAEEQHVRMERMALLVRCQEPVAQHLAGR